MLCWFKVFTLFLGLTMLLYTQLEINSLLLYYHIVLGFVRYSHGEELEIYCCLLFFQLLYLIGWIVAIVLGLTVVYGTWGASKPHGHPFSRAENIAYASLSRFTWAVAVAWVIFACQNGFGGKV